MTPQTARASLIDALTKVLFTMPPGPQRDALAAFMATAPSLAAIRVYFEAYGLVDHDRPPALRN